MHIIQRKIMQIAQKTDLSGLGLRKVGQLIDESYPQKIKYHLLQLKEAGYIQLDEGDNRIIKVLRKDPVKKGVKLFSIPVVGSASCGPAEMFAEQNIVGHVTVSQTILQNRQNADGIFAVQAVGDSLNKAEKIPGGVVDNGDLLIVDSNVKDPENGSYVLSVIEGCANAKRFYKDDENQVVKLVSESKLNIPDIVMHAEDLRSSDYLINGKVIRVLKD
jgi:SOS-response transcriptional repressor LexA